METIARLLALALLAAAASGCNRGPQYCDLKGQVIYNGKPLPGGTVVITNPEDTELKTAVLNIDGEFKASNVPAGEVWLAVQTETVKTVMTKETAARIAKESRGFAQPHVPDPKEVGNVYVKIPAKYADRKSSGLRFELEPNEMNEIKVELSD